MKVITEDRVWETPRGNLCFAYGVMAELREQARDERCTVPLRFTLEEDDGSSNVVEWPVVRDHLYLLCGEI